MSHGMTVSDLIAVLEDYPPDAEVAVESLHGGPLTPPIVVRLTGDRPMVLPTCEAEAASMRQHRLRERSHTTKETP